MKFALFLFFVTLGVPGFLIGVTKLAQHSQSDTKSRTIGTIAFVVLGLAIVAVLATQ